MSGATIAFSFNAVAFLVAIGTFVYRQGRTDERVSQIDKRLARIERYQNGQRNTG